MFHLEILGGATIRGPEGPLSGPAVQRQRMALLAILAVADDPGVSRDRILGILWPESPEDKARRSLSNALYELRRNLGDEAILASGDALRLNPVIVVSDVGAFQSAIRDDKPKLAARWYRGPLLEGFAAVGAFDRWVVQERSRLDREACGAIATLARAAEHERDYPGAAVHWRRLAALDPFSSRVAVSLMKALSAAGDRSGALQHAREHTALIRAELDSEPDPAVTDLADQLSTSPLDNAGPAPPAPTDRVALSHAAHDASPHQPPITPRRLAGAGAVAVAALAVIMMAVSTGRSGLADDLVFVAPLANETDDPEFDALGVVVADWLARALQEMRMVRVIDPRAVRTRLSGTDNTDTVAVWSLATQFGAGVIVGGSYRRRGDSLLIHAVITETGSSTLLASVGPVSAPVSDPLAAASRLQDEVTAAVAVLYSPELANFAHAITPPASYAAYRHYVVGSELAARGAYHEAIDQLERAVLADSTFAVAALYLATAYLNAGDFEEADRIAQSLDENRDRLLPAERYLLDWLRAFVDGNLRVAAREALRAREVAPHVADFAHLAGLMALLSGQPEDALDLLAAVDRDYAQASGNQGLWDDMSTAHHVLGRHDDELAIAADAQRRFPERLEPLLFEARALGALGRVPEIRRLLDRSLSTGTDAGGLTTGMLARDAAHALRAHGHDPTEIVQWAVDWYETSPRDGMDRDDARYLHALALYDAGRWIDARRLFDPLLAAYPQHPEMLGHAAAIAIRVGDGQAAEQLERRLASLDPRHQSGEPTLWRARLAALRGDSVSADRMIRQAFAEGLPWGFDLLHATEIYELALQLWRER